MDPKIWQCDRLGLDISTTDGMNKIGLVADILWQLESKYQEFDGSQIGLSVAAWAQYLLDNFATLAKAASSALEAEPFTHFAGGMAGKD